MRLGSVACSQTRHVGHTFSLSEISSSHLLLLRLQLLGNAHLLRGANWSTYGCSTLVSAAALTHLYCYHDVAAADDSQLAYAQLAQHAAEHDGPQV